MTRAKQIFLEETDKHPNFGLLPGGLPVILAAMEKHSKELALGFYNFTVWTPENAHWFDQEGNIIDLEDVYDQYMETLNPKKKGE